MASIYEYLFGGGGDDFFDKDNIYDIFDKDYNADDAYDSTFNYDSDDYSDFDYSSMFDDDFNLKDSTQYFSSDDYIKDLFKDYDSGNLFDDEGNYNYSGDYEVGDAESQINAWVKENIGYADTPDSSENYLDKILKFVTGATGEKREGNKLGPVGQGIGDFLTSPLALLLMANEKRKNAREQNYVPVGTEAFGDSGGQSSYGIPNLQPALLPGMAYANQPTTFNADPPGMQAGGLMAIPQGNKGLPNLPQSVRNNMGYMEAGGLAGGSAHHHPQLHSHAHGSRPNDIPGMPGMQDLLLRPDGIRRDGMQAGGVASLENMMDGPGDITQAMLEPGEFVMTRKATENLTPEYLYNLMHQAENAGRR